MAAVPSIAARRHTPWRKHRPHLQTLKCESLLWQVGRAEEEARSLFHFMLRTNSSPEAMKSLICVTDREFAALCAWAESRPTIAARLNDMMIFRSEVLKYFEAMLIEERSACSS